MVFNFFVHVKCFPSDQQKILGGYHYQNPIHFSLKYLQ